MSRKRHKPEKIVAKLRQVDVLVSQGTPIGDAIRSIGVAQRHRVRVADGRHGVSLISHDKLPRERKASLPGRRAIDLVAIVAGPGRTARVTSEASSRRSPS